MAEDRCQCDPKCKRRPLEGQPFCNVHIRRCTRVSPLSGSEPNYSPDTYNTDRRIRDTHNCFAYAIGAYDPPNPALCDASGDCRVKFHQPGNYAGYKGFSSTKKKRCPDIIARVLGDNPAIRLSRFEEKCPAGMSKIAFAVDPQNDYHVWRQDSNGFWSDKHGAQPVGNTDATGRLQYDPALINRNYKYSTPLNYTNFCSYMCVPRGGRVHAVRSQGGKRTRRRLARRGRGRSGLTRKH